MAQMTGCTTYAQYERLGLLGEGETQTTDLVVNNPTTVTREHAMRALLGVQMELYRQFSDNPTFRMWVEDKVFGLKYRAGDEDRTARKGGGR